MATGALDANGVWIYGEDDSEATFSSLLNKHASSIGATMKGRIAQVVTATTAAPVSTTSGSYVSSGLSASITPKFSTSKIIVLVAQTFGIDGSGVFGGVSIFKDSTNVELLQENAMYAQPVYTRNVISGTYVETSGSTTARTYSTKMRKIFGSGNFIANMDGSTATILIIEVTQ